MFIFQILHEKEAAQDSTKVNLPKIEFTQKDIDSTLAKLGKDSLSATSKDLRVLIFGLNNPILSEKCSESLGWLGNHKPNLFKEEHVLALLNGFGNQAAAGGCAYALFGLAEYKVGLFKEEHLAAIIQGLQNEPAAEWCALILYDLAKRKEFSEKCIRTLISGPPNKKGTDYSLYERGEALDILALETCLPLEELHDNGPEREKYLATLNTLQITVILTSDPEFFLTSSNHLLFDRLKKDLNGKQISRHLEDCGIPFDSILGRNFLFRAANYGRLYGKEDSMLSKEETAWATEAMLKPIKETEFNQNYYYLLANSLNSLISTDRIYTRAVVTISKELLKSIAAGNGQKASALEFILAKLNPETDLVTKNKKKAMLTIQEERSKYKPESYVGSDGYLTCMQVFAKADTEKDHWGLSNNWKYWNSAGWKKETMEDGKHIVFTNVFEKKRVILYMGESESENQSFITQSLQKYGNGIITFRGHSYHLVKNFPPKIFANNSGNWLFLPGSCGSAGSTADYIANNQNTSLSFISNTSTGRGQVTNELVSIFLGMGREVEFEKVKRDSSKTIEAQGGDIATLTFAPQGEMLLRYVFAKEK
ncbi:Uncharacterised protein [Candidatus Anstonella stagnisolia]|nr:Uncharacterised protein [Candidatus Anstonella stagnisolia]